MDVLVRILSMQLILMIAENAKYSMYFSASSFLPKSAKLAKVFCKFFIQLFTFFFSSNIAKGHMLFSTNLEISKFNILADLFRSPNEFIFILSESVLYLLTPFHLLSRRPTWSLQKFRITYFFINICETPNLLFILVVFPPFHQSAPLATIIRL